MYVVWGVPGAAAWCSGGWARLGPSCAAHGQLMGSFLRVVLLLYVAHKATPTCSTTTLRSTQGHPYVSLNLPTQVTLPTGTWVRLTLQLYPSPTYVLSHYRCADRQLSQQDDPRASVDSEPRDTTHDHRAPDLDQRLPGVPQGQSGLGSGFDG